MRKFLFFLFGWICAILLGVLVGIIFDTKGIVTIAIGFVMFEIFYIACLVLVGRVRLKERER